MVVSSRSPIIGDPKEVRGERLEWLPKVFSEITPMDAKILDGRNAALQPRQRR